MSLKKHSITVAGLGYVGLSNAVLLSQHNTVYAVDVVEEKVRLLNEKISPIHDDDITNYLQSKKLDLHPTTDLIKSVVESDFLIISTPTNYDENTNRFDTKSIYEVAKIAIQNNPQITIIIKSTIPIGFTNQLRMDLNYQDILFSPEFLREGKALYDNLYPSRIIVGSRNEKAKTFAALLNQGAIKDNIDILFMDSNESEAVKLFANTYLAMRVSYFNELDNFAIEKNLNAKDVIQGVSLDPRIGNYYNNPSFGYGGYCLPKDTRQMLANYKDIPQHLIQSIIDSNELRKNYLVELLLKKNPKSIGVYRLIMKEGSDNFRSSSIQDLIIRLGHHNIKIYIYEPELKHDSFDGYPNETNFENFINNSDVVIANRLDKKIHMYKDKVFTRDIFSKDD